VTPTPQHTSAGPGPSASSWRWYKGNLHAHTDRSDGRLPPPVVAEWYAGLGYDFLAITDHGRLTRLDSPRDGPLIVPGAEITAFDERSGAPYHIVALFEKDDGGLISSMRVGPPQATVDALVGAGATVILAHPYWLGLSSAETGALSGAAGVEVYNHLCELERGRGFSEQQWDELLLAGRRLWGVACDDCHFRMPDTGGGWIMLRAREGELTTAAVLQAIRRGDFYSTQGPEITRFSLEKGSAVDTAGRPADQVVVECSPCRKVVFHADRWLGSVVPLQECPGSPPLTGARHTLSSKETYVRAVCIDESGRKAWTNPLFLDWRMHWT